MSACHFVIGESGGATYINKKGRMIQVRFPFPVKNSIGDVAVKSRIKWLLREGTPFNRDIPNESEHLHKGPFHNSVSEGYKPCSLQRQ